MLVSGCPNARPTSDAWAGDARYAGPPVTLSPPARPHGRPHHSSFSPSNFCNLESSIRTEHGGTKHRRWEAAGPRRPDDDEEHGGATPFAAQPTEVMKLLHPHPPRPLHPTKRRPQSWSGGGGGSWRHLSP
jgi:hypothetical protein